MNAHDATEVIQTGHGWKVTCACGSSFTASSRADATRMHEGHHGVTRARGELDAAVARTDDKEVAADGGQ